MKIFSRILNPHDVEGWMRKAEEYESQGLGTFNGAIRLKVMECYVQALKIDPDYIPALLGMAQCLTLEAGSQYFREFFGYSPTFGGKKECLNKVIELCDKVLNLVPNPHDCCEALRLKAESSYDLGNYSDATQLYDEAIQTAKKHHLENEYTSLIEWKSKKQR